MFAVSKSWRAWSNAKSVAAVSVVALALGIGSTTAIFTVINAVMLKPLPYAQSDRFVALYSATLTDAESYGANSFPDLSTYQQRTRSFDVFGWYKLADFNVTSPGQPQHVNGIAVTPMLIHNLGISPIRGQWFIDDSGAVISTALWNRVGSDPNIVGKPLVLNGKSYTITGVAPSRFQLPIVGYDFAEEKNDVWVGLDPSGKGQSTNEALFFCYARLKPGVTFEQAKDDAKRVAAEIAAENPASHPSYTVRLDSLRETVVSGIRPTLMLLLGASGLLLLITSANVAGLMLARSVSRARETAICVSLGATRGQLAVQYLLESMVVSLAGAVAGVVFSVLLVRVVTSLATGYVPNVQDLSIDWTVLLFAVAVAIVASVLASLAPLWQASRISPNEVLSDGARASAGVRSRRLSQSLVVSEIALAFALLALSAVLIMHLRQLRQTSPGFDNNNLMAFQVTIADAMNSDDEKRPAYQKELLRAVESVQGVARATFTNQLPLDGCCLSTSVYPDAAPPSVDITRSTSFVLTTPTYFQTMRIALRRGRLLTDRDGVFPRATATDRNAPEFVLPIVINEVAAKHYWPDGEAVGASGRLSSRDGSKFQVVGVVQDVKNEGLAKPSRPELYLPSTLTSFNPMFFIVRSPLPTATLLPEVRRAIQSVDAGLPIHHVTTMQAVTNDSLTFERLGSFMTTFFALSALLMATLGIYGVMSYSVRQRVVEIGTRMALGATGRDVLSLVVGGGMKLALLGVVAGGVMAGVTWLTLLRALAIQNLEIFPFLSSAVVVGGVAASASFFPAWRATFFSPIVAIRNEPRSLWESARERVMEVVKRVSGDSGALADSALVAEFVDAARQAESSDEAIQRALASLCTNLGATFGMLMSQTGEEYKCQADALFGVSAPAVAQQSLSAHGPLLNRLRFCDSPLPISPGDVEAWSRWAAETAPQHLGEIHFLAAAGVRIAVALRAKTDISGVLLLGRLSDRELYADSEKQLLRISAQQFALMLENARLTNRIVEQEKIRRDLALAAEVQKRLLPEQPPETSGASLSAFSIPARSVGGDYYDFLELGNHKIAIALADVAGKGIAAALIMSAVQATLRIIAEEELSLPELAAKMNSFLHRTTPSNSYATFFYAQLDATGRRLQYVNAGHNPPYLVRSESEIVELPAGGTVVGLFPQMSYEDAAIDLRSGDVLVAFTDGVTEALNPSNDEFGEERLKALLQSVVDLSADEISKRISQALRSWIADAEQHDDLTFIVIKLS